MRLSDTCKGAGCHGARCAGAKGHVSGDGMGFARRRLHGRRRFEDLDCWKLSNELKLGVYELIDTSPAKRDLKFSEQLKKSASSAPANIAEGFAHYEHGESIRYARVAKGSLTETKPRPKPPRRVGRTTSAKGARRNAVARNLVSALKHLAPKHRSTRHPGTVAPLALHRSNQRLDVPQRERKSLSVTCVAVDLRHMVRHHHAVV